MEKRVVFRSSWLPWALMAPQLLVIVLFFFWPAGQALGRRHGDPQYLSTDRGRWTPALHQLHLAEAVQHLAPVAVLGDPDEG